MKKITQLLMITFAFFHSGLVSAQLSKRAQEMSKEGGSLFSEFTFWAFLIGAVVFIVALVCAISAKKNKQPLQWEQWGMVGGACLAIVMGIFTDFTKSLGGKGEQFQFERSDFGYVIEAHENYIATTDLRFNIDLYRA